MSEGYSALSEIQLLEQEIALLKNQLEGIQAADPLSVACPVLANAIEKSEAVDGFLVKAGGISESNQFHTSAGTTNSEDGCCVVL